MATVYKPELFDQMPIVGIMRNVTGEVIETIVPYYKKAGLTNLEITMNTANVVEIISDLSQRHPDLNIGAGTVCNMNDLEQALAAGASFIVTPILDLEVMKFCKKNDIVIFPGAYSPLEIYNAWQAGATAVKIFPANQLGPGYVKDVLAPLNEVRLLPTGGVSIENIEDFFEAGAVGVGMGSSLFDKQLIAAGEFERLYKHFLAVCKNLAKA